MPDPFKGRSRSTISRSTTKTEWRIAWAPRPGEAASRVRVYHLGALVEELEQPIEADAQIDAGMSHPDLRLSLSQSSAVRDEIFASGLKLLNRL